jgi:CHAT domain-containing protein
MSLRYQRIGLSRTTAVALALVLVAGLGLAGPAGAQTPSKLDLEQTLSQGSEAFARGWVDDAILYWTGALDAAEKLQDATGRIDILTRRAEAYRVLGYLDKSISDLKEAIGEARTSGAEGAVARLRGSLGNVYILAGEASAASAEFDAALSFAKTTGDGLLEARTLNDLGNLLYKQNLYNEAIDHYRRGQALANVSGDKDLQWTITVNAAYARNAGGDDALAERLLGEALDRVEDLPQTSRTVNGLVSIGLLLLKLEDAAQQSRPDYRRLAYLSFEHAMRLAEQIGDERGRSYAIGYAAQLYERERRYEEALQLTRQALFAAQRLGAPEALYLWEWQVGRIKLAMGDLAGATRAYRTSVATLRSIQSDFIAGARGGQVSFRNSVRPVILGLADLILRSTERTNDSAKRQVLLREARRTVELLKAAELEDYFQDNCMAALQAKEREIDRIAPRTVALYPIALPDRVELLLSLPGGLARITVPVSEERLAPVIRDFRLKLEKRTTRQYLAPARQLHDWLIRPIQARLAEHAVDTLVVIPSGVLSTIPFAALHDGKRHLVETVALATVPGLTLIEPRPIVSETAEVLAGGLTESVQGFPPLPFVNGELRSLSELFESTLFKDKSFVLSSIQQELESTPYTIVHVASHAQFKRDAEDSFVLTYDGRLTMDGLERFVKLSRFRDEPIELLTLSACSTAAGDERAALGLAGIGIKAGARTALATLWFINDESTAALISRFYAELRNPDTSKAEALRRAQLSLLTDRRSRHPGYWAPFLLIGNWL